MGALGHDRWRHARDGGLRRLRAGRAAVRGIQVHGRSGGGDRAPAARATSRPDPQRGKRMTTDQSARNPLVRLGELGQSPWYDYITRDLITTGELARLIAEDGLRGMTSNPSIFEKAVAGSPLYDADIRRPADGGRGAREIFEALAVADVQAAC